MKRAIPVGVSLFCYNAKQASSALYRPLALLALKPSTCLYPFRFFTIALFLLIGIPFITYGQKIEKLEQAANGRFATPNNPVQWVTGNVNEAKAHYAECMSIPYHLEVINLIPGQKYCVSIGYDTKKNGKNAIDFLTTYNSDIANSHSIYFGHTQNVTEVIDPTDNTALEFIGGYVTNTTAIPMPNFTGQTAMGSLGTPSTYYGNLPAADKLLTIYNGVFVTTPCYDSQQSLAGNTTSSSLRVCFELAPDPGNSLPEAVVLAWGGHIAAEALWGPGTSATSITGSPYHTFVAACGNNDPGFGVTNPSTNCNGSNANSFKATGSLDGCGNKEVQLQASSVVGGSCTIIGSDPLCLPTSGSLYTAIFSNPAPAGSYWEWTINNAGGGNNPSASFTSPGSTTTIAGTNLNQVTVYASTTGNFTLSVKVYTDATKTNEIRSCTKTSIQVKSLITPVITFSPTNRICFNTSGSLSNIIFRSDNATAANDLGELGIWTATRLPGGASLAGYPIPGYFTDNGLQNAGGSKNDDFNQATFNPNLSGPGTFRITYQFTTADGCESSASVDIVISYISIISGSTVDCASFPVTVPIIANVSAVSPSYQWQRSIDGINWINITSSTQDQLAYNVTYTGSISSSTLNVRLDGLSPVDKLFYRVIMTDGTCSVTSTNYLLSFQFCWLPIELTTFVGAQVDQTIVLKWRTETEKDNAYMEVQRSRDGINFSPLLPHVKGHGTTATPQSYLFVDQQPMPGINYYRLKQVDLDGKYEYHKVIAVPFESKRVQEIKIYPSPVKNMLTIEWSEKVNSEHILSITDMLGRTVLRRALAADTTQENLDVQALAPGYYFITIQTGNKVSAIKFVKE